MKQLNFKPILVNEELIYNSPVDNPKEWKTATNIMSHRTGILKQIGNTSLVECQDACGRIFYIHARSAIFNPRLDMRVFVSEHLRVDGHMEWLVTDSPILQDGSNINFINYGCKEHHVRIDYYTGESIIVKL